MRLKSWTYIILSLLCWSLLGTALIAIALRQRAIISIEQIEKSSFNASPQLTRDYIANIRIWIRYSKIIGTYGFLEHRESSEDLLKLLEQIYLDNSAENYLNKISCPACPSNRQELLAQLTSKVKVAKEIDLMRNEAQKNLLRLKTEHEKKIELHFLLAKDFSELLGASPLYLTQGKQELLYYSSGPFQDLPKIDDSQTDSRAESPIAIEDLSNRLEQLRAKSREIIKDYEKNEKILLEQKKILSELDKKHQQVTENLKSETAKVLKTDL